MRSNRTDNRFKQNKKAPSGAFLFYGLMVYLLLASHWVLAACDVSPASMKGSAWRQSVVKRVVDGDTLELEGGDRVRIIGVNAPETAKYGKPGDPLGREAWERLQALAAPGSTLHFRKDRGPRDRYGRWLLHPFYPDGRNLTTLLLQEGWGFHVVIPPNQWQAECYRDMEVQAQSGQRGVWGLAHYRPVDSDDASALKGGYSRVAGAVENVVLTRASAWIELKGKVSIKVAKKDLEQVDGDVWQRLIVAAQQKNTHRLAPLRLPILEVHGWMSDRRQWGEKMREQIANGERKPFQFNVRHRYDWKLLDAIHGD